MEKTTLIIGIIVLCLSSGPWAAGQDADFSGTWILDAKNSDPFPRPIMNLSAPTNVEMGGGFGGMGGMGGGMPPGGMGGGMPGGGMPGAGPGGKGPQAPPEYGPLVIKQSSGDIQISTTMSMNGKEMPLAEAYKLDGNEVVEKVPAPNSPDGLKKTTKVTLKKNKLQVRVAVFNPQGKNETRKDYSLSKDGKTMTLHTKTTSSMGMMVFQTEQKQIFTRQ